MFGLDCRCEPDRGNVLSRAIAPALREPAVAVEMEILAANDRRLRSGSRERKGRGGCRRRDGVVSVVGFARGGEGCDAEPEAGRERRVAEEIEGEGVVERHRADSCLGRTASPRRRCSAGRAAWVVDGEALRRFRAGRFGRDPGAFGGSRASRGRSACALPSSPERGDASWRCGRSRRARRRATTRRRGRGDGRKCLALEPPQAASGGRWRSCTGSLAAISSSVRSSRSFSTVPNPPQKTSTVRLPCRAAGQRAPAWPR